MIQATIFEKTKSRVTATAIVLSAFLFRCSSPQEPPPLDSCENLVANFDAAMSAYTSDPTNRTKCIAVKGAGADLLNCPGLSTSDKEDYKAVIDAIFCN
jgi:hypothetical protein